MSTKNVFQIFKFKTKTKTWRDLNCGLNCNQKLNICQDRLRSEMTVSKNCLFEPGKADIGDAKKNISPRVFLNFSTALL